MNNQQHNNHDLLDKSRKEHKNFDYMMFMYIANAIKDKELDDEDALDLYKRYNTAKKRNAKQASINFLLLLLLLLPIVIMIYLEVNDIGAPTWVNNIPFIVMIPFAILVIIPNIYTNNMLIVRWSHNARSS